MPQTKLARVENLLTTNTLVELVHARLTRQIGGTGRRHVLPSPFAIEDQVIKQRLHDLPLSHGGVRGQVLEEEEQAAIQHAIDVMLGLIGAHPATIEDLVNHEVRKAIQALYNAIGASPAPPPSHPHLANLVLSQPINFDGAVPVGGWTNLSLFPGGDYNFSGHLHDSGAASYDYSVVWVVVATSSKITFVFPQSGRLHGTFEKGSRDDDWNKHDVYPPLADAWDDLSANYSWQCSWGANMDIQQLIDAATQAVGDVGKVVKIVESVS